MSRRPFWVRTYLAGEERLERLVRDVHAFWSGVWLGLLTPAQLETLDKAYYDNEAVYRTEAHNRRGLFAWEQEAVTRYFPSRGHVAVLGAGGGREVVALLSQGYDAWGFEPNADLAAIGARLTTADGYGIRVAVAPRTGWSATPRSFDAVLVGWGAYMLIASRRARVDFLRNASIATRRSGVVILSFFTLVGDRRQFHLTYRVARFVRRLLGRPAPLLGDALVPNFAHHFTRSQIVDEVEAAGMELVNFGVTDGGYGWAVARKASADEGALRD